MYLANTLRVFGASQITLSPILKEKKGAIITLRVNPDRRVALCLFDATNVRFVFYVNSIKRTKVKINKKKPVARITTNLTTG